MEWLAARSEANWILLPALSLITLKNSRTKIWCACGAKARISGIPQILRRCRICLDFCTRSVARGTRLYNQKRSFAANRRPQMNTDLKEIVQEKYGDAAKRVRAGEGLPADCCSK